MPTGRRTSAADWLGRSRPSERVLIDVSNPPVCLVRISAARGSVPALGAASVEMSRLPRFVALDRATHGRSAIAAADLLWPSICWWYQIERRRGMRTRMWIPRRGDECSTRRTISVACAWPEVGRRAPRPSGADRRCRRARARPGRATSFFIVDGAKGLLQGDAAEPGTRAAIASAVRSHEARDVQSGPMARFRFSAVCDRAWSWTTPTRPKS